jgi:hypothetical protein
MLHSAKFGENKIFGFALGGSMLRSRFFFSLVAALLLCTLASANSANVDTTFRHSSASVSAAPQTGSLLLLSAGLIGIAGIVRRKLRGKTEFGN